MIVGFAMALAHPSLIPSVTSVIYVFHILQTPTTEEGIRKGALGKTGGLQKQLDAHKKKLAHYMDNPDAFDNEGFLKNADFHNRLTKITEKDGTDATTKVVEHTYDVFNRRVAKEVDRTSPFDMHDVAAESSRTDSG